MREPVATGKPVVVKVGSSSLTRADGHIDPAAISSIVDQVDAAWRGGYPVVLVTSGAVAAGIPSLGKRPTDLPGLQAAAAVGQGRLMERYTAAFDACGRVAGQVLLTKNVLEDRAQYLNAREAITRLLELGVVPVVNENDTVAVEELRFGDNDRLAAVVSHLVGAGMLVILTDTAGLYSGDPRLVDDVELISAVRHTDQVLDELTAGRSGPIGSGGPASKVAAARIAAWSGVPTVIAKAGTPGVLQSALAGEEVGTWVGPHADGLPARKLWIAFGQPAEGKLVVDDGAVKALQTAGKSLLAVGVKAVMGSFAAGAAVEVISEKSELVAKGLVRLSSGAIATAAGKHSSEVGGEVIHRDDLVLLV